MSDEIRPLLERHRAFWEAGARVLLESVGKHHPLAASGGIPLANGGHAREGEHLSPERIDPERFYGEGLERGALVRGDFVGGVGIPHLCWTEAIVGCPVRVVTGGPWAQPFGRDWRRPAELEPDSPWLGLLTDFTALLLRRTGGNRPVIQPLMRGPIDMMASALGHEEACLALVEEPGAAGAFLDLCARFFLVAARRQAEGTPALCGGHVCAYGIWAPGTVVRTQADNATMLSPAVYRDVVLPHERTVIEAFDFPLIHLHSGCLHVAELLAGVPALKAIQVSIDYPGGPLASDVLPILERVAGRKSLILTGPVTRRELAALERLADQGSLCLQVELLD
ncbi:MAG: uroporphyrinogen decarboxylase family protein [Candidatus Latescibacterota bacterium]